MSDKNLAEEFSRLLVEPKNTFEAYFLEFSPCTSIANTDSEFSCHMIRIDASGKDRTEAIANMVSQRIISYAIPRSEMPLEFGVSKQTQVSLMGLGLSRNTAILLDDYISNENLSPTECIKWLRNAALDSYNLNEINIREIKKILEQHTD